MFIFGFDERVNQMQADLMAFMRSDLHLSCVYLNIIMKLNGIRQTSNFQVRQTDTNTI